MRLSQCENWLQSKNNFNFYARLKKPIWESLQESMNIGQELLEPFG